MASGKSDDRHREVEVPIKTGQVDPADASGDVRGDGHSDGQSGVADHDRYGRRASDVALGTVAETAEHIESKVTSVRSLVLIAIGVGTAVSAIMFWLGWRNESPGARLAAIEASGVRRDSVLHAEVAELRMSVSELRLTVRELGYTVCLSASQGKTPDGPTRCAQQFLIVREPR